MKPTLHFISGLPRTGSTLLVNLLGQNPAHHVSGTSGLVHLFLAVTQRWTQCREFQAQGLGAVKGQVSGALRGMLHGYYDQPLSAGRVVFDKSRGWLDFIEPLEQALGEPVKVIVPVRDVRSIVASFEKIYRRRGIGHRYTEPIHDALVRTVEGRAEHALRTDQVTGRGIARLRDALQRCPDRMLIVPYERLTEAPVAAMDRIHAFLGLSPFEYKPGHVEQVTAEDDEVIGQDLHTIRPVVEPSPDAPWDGILPEALCAQIDTQYADLNRLAAGPICSGTDAA